MSLRIDFCEPTWLRWLKLIYLVPVALILYPFAVVIYGIREVGNPFGGFSDMSKKRRSRL